MSAIRLATIIALIAALGSCGRVEAAREFEYGVNYFNDEKFDAAARSFERAAETHTDPAIAYNLALARLAQIRKSVDDDGSKKPNPQQIGAALAAVATARELPDLTDGMLAKLGYIEGSIHVLAGEEEAARDAFSRSLKAQPEFRPTLKAVLELEPEFNTAIGRFVLATVDVEELKPEEKLSR